MIDQIEENEKNSCFKMEKSSEDWDFPFYKMQTHLIDLPNILLLKV